MPKEQPPETGKTARTEGVAALDRAFAILSAFRPDDTALTLTEISERTGLYKSTILRLAGSLIQHQFLVRLEDRRYQIGPAPFILGNLYQKNLRVGDVLLPLMRELNEATGESVSFHVREGDVRVCLHRISARHAVRTQVREGDVLPLETGAGGRILMAFGGAEGEVFDRVRRDHYYISVGERDAETAGISVPVFGVRQRLVGALGVVGPVSRVDRFVLNRIRPDILGIAIRATALLGGDPEALKTAAVSVV